MEDGGYVLLIDAKMGGDRGFNSRIYEQDHRRNSSLTLWLRNQREEEEGEVAVGADARVPHGSGGRGKKLGARWLCVAGPLLGRCVLRACERGEVGWPKRERGTSSAGLFLFF